MQSALLGGSGGMPPRKIFDFRPSEIVSGAVLGQNSYQLLVIGIIAVGVVLSINRGGYIPQAPLLLTPVPILSQINI